MKPSEDPHTVHLKFKPVWYGFLSHAHISPTPKPRQSTGPGLLCSSDRLWISVRGFHTAEKLMNNSQKTGRLSPKCHVSLNQSQRWLFYPVMANDNAVRNLSPGAHLHSNKPRTSCSPFFSFSGFFFSNFFRQKKKLHFSRDRDVIIWAFRTRHSLWGAGVFISYFTGDLQLYRNLCTPHGSTCTVFHMANKEVCCHA